MELRHEATLRSHRGVVMCAAFSPNMTRLLSASSSGEVLMWCLRRRRLLLVWQDELDRSILSVHWLSEETVVVHIRNHVVRVGRLAANSSCSSIGATRRSSTTAASHCFEFTLEFVQDIPCVSYTFCSVHIFSSENSRSKYLVLPTVDGGLEVYHWSQDLGNIKEEQVTRVGELGRVDAVPTGTLMTLLSVDIESKDIATTQLSGGGLALGNLDAPFPMYVAAGYESGHLLIAHLFIAPFSNSGKKGAVSDVSNFWGSPLHLTVDPILALAYAPCKQLLSVGAADGTLAVFQFQRAHDVDLPFVLRPFLRVKLSHGVGSLVFPHPCGYVLCAIVWDQTLRFFDVPNSMVELECIRDAYFGDRTGGQALAVSLPRDCASPSRWMKKLPLSPSNTGQQYQLAHGAQNGEISLWSIRVGSV